jgi:hypothetical protein
MQITNLEDELTFYKEGIMKNTIRNVAVIIFPLTIGVLAGFLANCFITKPLELPRIEFLLDTIISSSATISGFILASVTILVGATTSKIMQDIKNKFALTELRWRYSETLVLGLSVMIYFTCLGVIIGSDNKIPKIHLVISIGTIVSYLYSVITTCYYLLSIIGKINDNPPIIEGGPSSPSGNYR